MASFTWSLLLFISLFLHDCCTITILSLQSLNLSSASVVCLFGGLLCNSCSSVVFGRGCCFLQLHTNRELNELYTFLGNALTCQLDDAAQYELLLNYLRLYPVHTQQGGSYATHCHTFSSKFNCTTSLTILKSNTRKKLQILPHWLCLSMVDCANFSNYIGGKLLENLCNSEKQRIFKHLVRRSKC